MSALDVIEEEKCCYEPDQYKMGLQDLTMQHSKLLAYRLLEYHKDRGIMFMKEEINIMSL